MYRRTIIYVSFLLILVLAGLVIGMNLLRAPEEVGEEEKTKESQKTSEEKAAGTIKSNKTEALVTLENYDWNFLGMSKWKLENLHTLSGFIMSLLLIVHLILNYKLFVEFKLHLGFLDLYPLLISEIFVTDSLLHCRTE